MTDSSEPEIASCAYDSFGNLIDSTGTSDNPYGFTGEQQFGEADSLVFLRARYYNPYTGRFISRDPIGYDDGMNLYVYVHNNPVILTDPMGMLCCDWGAVGKCILENIVTNPDLTQFCLIHCGICAIMPGPQNPGCWICGGCAAGLTLICMEENCG